MTPRQNWIARWDALLQQITPDPFILALALSGLTLLGAAIVSDRTPVELINFWSQGFWSLTTFTLQMLMILVAGFILASAPIVRKALALIADRCSSETSAILALTLASTFAYVLNWALGLVVGAFLAIEIAKRNPRLNLRILVASSYTGFVVWHGGFSGSIPLLLNTAGNFSEKWIGRPIPLNETLFSTINLACVGTTLLFLPLFNIFAAKALSQASPGGPTKPIVLTSAELGALEVDLSVQTWADRIELSPWFLKGVGLFLFGTLLCQVFSGSWSLDLNRVITLLLAFGFFLHPHLRAYSKAAQFAIGKGSGILLQYPFYGGIMGVMTNTNLTQWISEKFIALATPDTFGVLTLWAAAFVNFLVPSGGGQWAVQGPIALEGAKTLGIDYGFTAMAVAWGGTLTDLAQPFWALPVLAIVGLKARDIIGPCLITLGAMTAIISALFYFLSPT